MTAATEPTVPGEGKAQVARADRLLDELDALRGDSFRLSPQMIGDFARRSATKKDGGEDADEGCGRCDIDWESCAVCDVPADKCTECDAMDCFPGIGPDVN